jgi:AraC-like DNA-binding protein
MATVSGHHVLTGLRGAQRQGHSREALLKEAGIDPQSVDTAGSRVSDYQMTRLFKLIWKELNDEFMGFTATPCKPGAFSFAVNTIRSSHNLRSALLTGFQFYNLMTDDISTELLEEGDSAIIDISFARPELDADYFFQEFWMVIWHRLASWLTGIRIPLAGVNFALVDHQYRKELNYMFPCPHVFGTDTNQLIFDSNYLSLPLIRSEKQVSNFLARSPFNLMSIPGSDHTLQGRIVGMLTPPRNAPLELPTIEVLAERLDTSPTSLRRHLAAEATNYKTIKDDLRRDTALKKLAEERLPIYSVAKILGFSESSAFIRAFKGWTGMTPLQYCKSLENSSA